MATRRQLPRDLRPEVRAKIEPFLEPDSAHLSAIARVLSQKRTEAKAARVASGIERIWQYCDDAYKGEDLSATGPWEKPLDSQGPLTRDVAGEEDEVKSKAVVRLTARYVDAGAAKLSEILLPMDDKAFSIKGTPIASLIPLADDKSQVVDEQLGPLNHPDQPEAPSPMIPGVEQPAQPPEPLKVKDVIQEQAAEGDKRAKKAEKRIYDWLVESRYRRHARRVIADAARLGVGVLKGPIPKPSQKMAVTKNPDDGGVTVVFEEKITPAVERKDPWNIYPDPACGESIAEGDYVFEVDYLTQRQVRGLKKQPGYIAAAIDQVIKEGPQKVTTKGNMPAKDQDPSANENRFEVWYYNGFLERDDLACICHAAGKPITAETVPEAQLEVPVVVTMINDCIVKASLAMLDSGRLPYHNMPWQTRDGYWAGIGVAEQVSTPQAMVTAGTRAVLNNAGVAAGVQIVIDVGLIEPMDGSWNITPNKVWVPKSDAGMAVDIQKAFQVFQVPSIVQQIMIVIEYGMRLAEESTSIPLVTQGMSGPTQPDTFGGMQLQNNNANQLLRSIGYDFDDHITVPLIGMLYEWLLADPNVPNDEKGDFEVNAHGSAALVERAIQDQLLPQLLPASLNPAYRMKPWQTMAELLKAKRFDPRTFQYDDEEWAAVSKQQAPDPVVQAAQIRATAQIEAAKLSTGVQHERVAAEGVIEAHKIKSTYELALLEYANAQKLSLDDVKAQLAKTTMELQTQQQMHADDLAADAEKGHPAAPRRQRAPAPPVQLPGRAGNGRAFEQGP